MTVLLLSIFILENNKSLESLTPEEEFFVSHKEQSSLKEKIHTIVSHFIKNERSKGILNDYIDGYTKEELGQKYSLTPNRCVQIIEKNAKFIRLNEKDIERTRTTETVDGNIKHIFKYREFNSGRVGSWLEDTY